MLADADDSNLSRAAALATQTFATTEEASEAVLDLLIGVLGMRSVFMTRTDQGVLRVIAARNSGEDFVVPVGLEIPLALSPCHRVAGSVEPLIVPNMVLDPTTAELPTTVELAARAYVGVPVLRGDGTLFGTLCGLDPSPQDPSRDEVSWMQVLARLLVYQIDRDELDRRKEEIVEIASHDLQQPTSSIIGHAQLLRAWLAGGALDQERLGTGLAIIEEMGWNMAAQLADLVDAVRLRLGRPLDLRRVPTDLVDLGRAAVSEHRTATVARHLRLEASVQTLEATVDPVRVRRVLANLLSNAVKYSPEGGEIVVGVDRDEGPDGPCAVLTVRDRGIGIPADDLPHLFEWSHRGRNVGRISGTGIGLAGSYRIARQHGGTISVESREGEGSSFAVRLPIDAPGDPGTPSG